MDSKRLKSAKPGSRHFTAIVGQDLESIPYKELTVIRTPVTLSLAQYVAGLPCLENDRFQKENIQASARKKIARYAKMFSSGRETSDFEWTIAFDEENQTFYRIDGGHTSHLFANKIIPVTGTSYYKVLSFLNKEHIKLYWSTLDNAVTSRTKGQVFQGVIIGNEEFKDLSQKVLSSINSAYCYIYHGYGYANFLDNSEKAAMSFDEEAVEFTDWIRSIKELPKFMHRVGVQYGMIVSWRISPELAKEYAEEVTSGYCAAPNSGSYHARSVLMNRPVNQWVEHAVPYLRGFHLWLSGKTVADMRLRNITLSSLDKFLNHNSGKVVSINTKTFTKKLVKNKLEELEIKVNSQ
jgi:hypothetical protein